VTWSNPLRFRALDGWRGICALLVAAHHLEVHGFLYWQPLVRNAWLFVDFFFVLSGFVIAHAYGETLSNGAGFRVFVIRRFGRLWPLHAAVLVALVAIEFSHLVLQHGHPIAGEHVAFTFSRSPFAILTNLFLVQALGFHPFDTWNGPAWSISGEFCTYLVFAALCAIVPKRPQRLLASLALAFAAVAILVGFSDYGMRETFRWALPRCIFGFFLGTLTYEAWRRGAMKRVAGTWLEAAAVAFVVAFVTYVPGHAALEYLAPPLFCLVVLVFAGDSGLFSRLLAMRATAALGRWSYSIYMVHTLILVAGFSAARMAELQFDVHWLSRLPNGEAAVAAHGAVVTLVLYFAYLAIVIGSAAFTWRFVELPGQRFFGNIARRRTVQAQPYTA
jgi:peptidoglycan/LPS O-acetylase OafA/YrhL